MSIYPMVREAQIRHAREIDAIERDVNGKLHGDASIGELVALMLLRGWTPPEPVHDQTDLPSAADVRGILADE
jgi:hypothetical protein